MIDFSIAGFKDGNRSIVEPDLQQLMIDTIWSEDKDVPFGCKTHEKARKPNDNSKSQSPTPPIT